MKFLNKLLMQSGISPRSGDIVSLHKGSYEVYPHTSPNLKAELKALISSGIFNIKLKLFPNVSGFKITLGSYNPLLASHGFLVRHGSKKELLKGRNRRVNRYLTYSYLRLSRLVQDPEQYWTVALNLIQRSHAYLIVSMRYVDKNLYRTLTAKRMKKLLKSVNILRANKLGKEQLLNIKMGIPATNYIYHWIEYYRAYLPKGTSDWRPLGVPTLTWRIFLSMWLVPLNGFLPIGEYQNGFQPNRGTLTAWQRVMKVVIPKANIFELDFKGFFPSVLPEMVTIALEKKNTPPHIIDYLQNLNNSLPRHATRKLNLAKPFVYPKSNSAPAGIDLKVHEVSPSEQSELSYVGNKVKEWARENPSPLFQYNHRIPLDVAKERPFFRFPGVPSLRQHSIGKSFFLGLTAMHELYPPASLLARRILAVWDYRYWSGQVTMAIDAFNTKIALEQMKKTGKYTPTNTYFNQFHEAGKKPAVSETMHTTGLPQGSSLSPFLSSVYLEIFQEAIKERYPSVELTFYADDGIFSSDDSKEFERFLKDLPSLCDEFHLRLSYEKSRIVKAKGKWIENSFKFLGLRYHSDGTLISETRKGSPNGSGSEGHGRRLQWDFALLEAEAQMLEETEGNAQSYGYRRLLDLLVTTDPSTRLGYFLQLGLMTLSDKKSLLRFLSSPNSRFRNFLRYNKNLVQNSPQLSKMRTIAHTVASEFKSNLPSDFVFDLTKSFDSIYSGLIFSRLYNGTKLIPKFNTKSGSQNFQLKYKTGSIAHIMCSRYGDAITLSNGSSYADYELMFLSKFCLVKRPPEYSFMKLGLVKTPD